MCCSVSLADADVCITTLRPPELEALRLQPDDLRAMSDRLIVVAITPFGLDGPWADRLSSDLVGLALGSPLNSCGYDDHSIPPIRPGGDQAYQSACSFALMALLLALVDRQQSGRGQLLDVGMHDCLAVSAELANPYWFYPRVVVNRQTCRHAQPTPTAPALFQCGDGRYVYFVLFVADLKPWRALVEWMDTKDLAVDLLGPEYEDAAYRQANFGHIQELVEVFFLLQTADEAYHDGQARGLLGRCRQLARRPLPRRAPDAPASSSSTSSTTTCRRPLPGRTVPVLRLHRRRRRAGAEARRAHRRGPRHDCGVVPRIISETEDADKKYDGTAAGPGGGRHRRYQGHREGHRRGVRRRRGQGRRQRAVGGQGPAGPRGDEGRRPSALHRLRRQGPGRRRAAHRGIGRPLRLRRHPRQQRRRVRRLRPRARAGRRGVAERHGLEPELDVLGDEARPSAHGVQRGGAASSASRRSRANRRARRWSATTSRPSTR